MTAIIIIISNNSFVGQICLLCERWDINHSITSQIINIFYSHSDLLVYEKDVWNWNYEEIAERMKAINAILNTDDEVAVPFLIL